MGRLELTLPLAGLSHDVGAIEDALAIAQAAEGNTTHVLALLIATAEAAAAMTGLKPAQILSSAATACADQGGLELVVARVAERLA